MLGCGEIGALLLEREPRFIVVERGGEVLHEKGYRAVVGDPADMGVAEKAIMRTADVVVVLDEQVSVQQVREVARGAFIVVVDSTKMRRQQAYEGADCVVPTSACAVDECIHQIRYYEKMKRKKNLEEVLLSGKKMAIIMHDNPDPDCISSALALKLIGEKVGVVSDVFYGGQIGYQENKVLVELLGLTLIPPVPQPRFSRYDIIAFVDHSPWDYTCIARDVTPDIVIDHHILPEYKGRFVDVREDVGSTSTILVEYLQAFEVNIDSKLATGLFYGLLVDTHNFRRGISDEDIEALAVLRGKMDVELLSRVEKAGFSRGLGRSHADADFLDVLGEAVKNMQEREGVVFSCVGKVKYRDAVSSSADYLLKLEKVDVVVVYGIIGDSVYISARSWDEQLHVGKLLKKAFKGLGKAGGHPLIGGATIPLEDFSKNFEEELIERVLQAKSTHS